MKLPSWIRGDRGPVALAECMAETAIHLSDLKAKRIDKTGFVKKLEVLNRKKIQCPACTAQYVLGEATTIRRAPFRFPTTVPARGSGSRDR